MIYQRKNTACQTCSRKAKIELTAKIVSVKSTDRPLEPCYFSSTATFLSDGLVESLAASPT